jgi:hypothetical protein
MMAREPAAGIERRTEALVLRRRDLLTPDDRRQANALGPMWGPALNRTVLCLLARGRRRKLESLEALRVLTGIPAAEVEANGGAFLELAEHVAKRWRLQKDVHRWMSAKGGLASGLRSMAERVLSLTGEARAALERRILDTLTLKVETTRRWYLAAVALADHLGHEPPDDPHAPQPSHVNAENHAGERIGKVAERLGSKRHKLRGLVTRLARPVWRLLTERQQVGGLLTYEDIEAALLLPSPAFVNGWASRWGASPNG